MAITADQSSSNSTGDQSSENASSTNGNVGGAIAEAPSIVAPKGGGAIQSIGEKFQANAVTGTGSMSVPVAISPGRNGFQPQMALSYDSGSGNSPFGLGWNIAHPSIVRKTQKGLPKYQDQDGQDVFLLAGAEDLVPLLKENGGEWETVEQTDGNNHVKRYRPRIEGLFARIEKHTDLTTRISHWRVTTKDNMTSVYGASESARVYDPAAISHVFEWKLEYTFDEKGNVMHYRYKREDAKGVNSSALHEKNRTNTPSQLYLKNIRYTPDTPYDDSDATYFDTVNWHFEVVLDYGEHDLLDPKVSEDHDWPAREDAFSSYRSGFEIRTHRLCQRILMFHSFAADLGVSYLVKSTNLDFDENPLATQVRSIKHVAYENGEDPQEYPPITFEYTQAAIDAAVHEYDIENSENLPSGVDGVNYRWEDLHGEGLPGVLVEDQNAWYFKQNLGDENYYKDLPANAQPSPEARLGALQQVRWRPNLAGGQQLSDLNGNGTQDLVVNTPQISGYYAQSTEGEWARFKAFDFNPNINWSDPHLKRIDVNGDGFADLLISEDHCFVCYPAEGDKGFGASFNIFKSLDEEQGPAIVFADPDQSIYLADMSGDGMTDIVRIRNGSICYWPNLGHGKFGAKIGMDHAPWMDHEDTFNQERIRLADVDGSGTTDVIYISDSRVGYFPNLSGNSFGEEVWINQHLPTHNLTAITVLDLLGKGTQCLVWSSPVIGDHPPAMKYMDLMSGVKPYLLTEVNNNSGMITRTKYAPSTKFYLRDKRNRTPWITKLSFPVLVVERVEIWDEIKRHRFVTNYAYHHGYFDGVEREFRGFGMVEQWDTESFSDFIGEGLFPTGYNATEEILHAAPIYTKSWFHTGFYQDQEKILGQYEKEYWADDQEALRLERGPALATGQDYTAKREAARALKGSLLRQEIYGQDGSPEAAIPYSVSESTYEVKLIQPRASDRRDRDYASFLVVSAESLAHQYERNAADPRVSHQVVLDTDQYGTPLVSAAVAYPRRVSVGYSQQDVTLITIAESNVIHEDSHPDFYRLGVPIETKQYELTGFTALAQQTKSALLDALSNATALPFEEVATSGVQKRLLAHAQILYYDANLSNTPLAFGAVAAHGLAYQTFQLAMTDGLINNIMNADGVTRVDASLLTSGGYEDLLNDGNQWVPSGKVQFDPAHFYLPIVQIDPFGNQSSVVYDSYYLLPTQTVDALGNTSSAVYDYRVMQPELVTDANGNQQEFAFDVAGMLSKMAQIGKNGEGDTLVDPTAIFEYDLMAWKDRQEPNSSYAKTRETHGDGSTRWMESHVYVDGMGQEAMTKMKVAPGLAYSRDAQGVLLRNAQGELELIDTTNTVLTRWVGNGRTILDNKGNPVKQYEPYFSSTEAYEVESELVEYGVTPVIHYDPLGRAIRTELPDLTHTRVAFSPWLQKNYDQNDTVLERLKDEQGVDKDSWYSLINELPVNSENEAIIRAASSITTDHGNTPQVIHMDQLGRPFETIDDNGADGQYTMTTELDIQGQPKSITDANGRLAFTYLYDMLGQPIKTYHLDQGTKYALNNIVGNPLRAWDDRLQQFSFLYDELLRPTRSYLITDYSTAPSAMQLLAMTVYGESTPSPATNNLKGQAYMVFDSAGLVTNHAFDFKGQLLSSQRQLAAAYQTSPDWIDLDQYVSVAELLVDAAVLLDGEVFSESMTYDALGRPTLMIKPDLSEVRPSYDDGGQLIALHTKLPGQMTETAFVLDITYNARGQREKIQYANNTQTSYSYDALTFRLDRLLSTKNLGADKLQDLNYTYDPVGNIVEQEDQAQKTHFFANTEIDPVGKYKYDALYRLTSATGRELIGLAAPTSSELTTSTPIPDSNAIALQFYDHTYKYDAMGNIKELKNTASTGNWTRYYHYDHPTAPTSNYLLSTSSDNTVPTSDHYTYDAHGNMTAMPHLASMGWDYADRLQSADLGGGGMAYYTYDAGGNRIRKVIEKANIVEERIYLGDYEVYRKTVSGVLDTERSTLHMSDDTGRIALVDTLTVDGGNAAASPVSNIRYQLSNHLGSAALELDASANIISYEEYHPFGSTSYRSGRSAAETSLKRYRYVGKERDEETGLYYYGARYYAAWLCRFVSVDPLKDKYPQLNPYNYADNTPITDLDIDGQQNTTTEDRTGGVPEKQKETPAFDSGNKEFDKTANQILSQFGADNVSINVTNVDGNVSGQITIGDQTAYYDSENGFFTKNEDGENQSLKTGEDGALLPPSDQDNLNILGQSAVAVYDNELRTQYTKDAKATGKSKLLEFNGTKTPPQEAKVMREAIDDRNTLKKDVRKKLSPGARQVTKALEQDSKYTVKNLKEAYGPGGEKGTNLEGRALRREVTRASGRSNKLLKGLAKISRGLGWVGVALGTILTGVDLYQDPSPENFGEEGGALIGGAIGSTLGTAAFLAAGIALGIATGGLGFIAIGIVGGIIGGYAGSEIGGSIGRKSVQKIRN